MIGFGGDRAGCSALTRAYDSSRWLCFLLGLNRYYCMLVADLLTLSAGGCQGPRLLVKLWLDRP